MDIFAETMKHFNMPKYTPEQEQELKQDVIFEKLSESKDVKEEQEKENG